MSHADDPSAYQRPKGAEEREHRTERTPISKRVRFEIFARDGFTCRYCGVQSDKAVMVVDHVHPVCQGGTNAPENLITSCEPCNQGKAGKTIDQAVPSEQDRLRLAQERNEQVANFHAVKAAIEARENIRNLIAETWCGITGRDTYDAGTITVMVRYMEEFGVEMLISWIEKSAEKVGTYDDRKMGRYVSGIRRNHLEKIDKELEGVAF